MKLFTLLPALSLYAMAPSLLATTILSTDFTSVDGFTEGGIVHGNGGWTTNDSGTGGAETTLLTTNVASNGQLEIVAGTLNFIRLGQSIGNFAINETVSVSSTFAIFNTTGNIGFNAFGWSIGLGETANTIDAGTRIGGTGQDFILGGLGGGSINNLGARDTIQHTISTEITKTATANTFDVSIFFDGGAAVETFQVVDAGLYNAANVFLVGQAGGGGVNSLGGVTVDNLSAAPIPEPSALALIGLGSLSFLARRRR